MIALAMAFACRLEQRRLAADARAMRLLSPMASTLIAGAIVLIGPPLRPPAGSLPTGLSCNIAEWTLRLEWPLASLQQAEALSATR